MMSRLLSKKFRAPPQPELCEGCGVRPKYVEADGVQHPFCGKTCARKSMAVSSIGCPYRKCNAPGKAIYAGFCSEKHAKHGVSNGQAEACENCNVMPKRVGTLCVACSQAVSSKGGLKELHPTSKAFKTYERNFLDQWDSPGKPVPTVAKIFQIDVSRDARDKQHACRSTFPSAIEIKTYHSSQCICNFGAANLELCNYKSCGICCIAKSSFETLAFGARHNHGRFGEGIYSYRNPALADRFATSCTTSPYRVSIGCTVIVDGSTANDDDAPIFVKNAEAIVPFCLFVYHM